MPIPVTFDTDIGSDIDDTWALGFLLRCPELDVKLVTTCRGLVSDAGGADRPPGNRANVIAREDPLLP